MMLSIMTLSNNYPDIWNYFRVPGIIDKDTAINKIVLECAELEVLYSDPDILKYIIRSWTQTEYHIWEKLAETLKYEYDPIYNLDVTWEETRTPNLTRTKTPNITETRTPDLTETKTPNITVTETPNVTETRTPNVTETETPTDTTTESVAGYNSSTFADHTRTTRGGSITKSQSGTETTATTGTSTEKTTGTDTTKHTGTESIRRSGSETDRETGSETVVTRRFGNQGVTMTQQMIEAEREVVQFSLYDYICKSFKNKFCLLIY